jgi:LTXXQ motif family protein
MSKLNLRLAVLVLATVLSAAGYAAAKGGGGGGGGHGGGGHGGGGHGGGAHFHGGGGHGGGHFGGRAHFGGGGRHFGGRSVSSRSFARPGFSGNRAFAVHNFRSGALNSRGLSRSMRSAGALQNPGVRAQMAAGAALAGWHNGRDGSGWWRHGNGGYGWVGPLFWPFAYFDIYDYAIWGNGVGASFWGYGYDDIYAGMFAPYGYDALAGYLPPRTSPAAGGAAPDRLAQMCGDDSREIAGLPIDLIQQAIEPTETQRAALDELASASVTAAQNIKAACPTTISLTAPNRLASMQQRIEAMIAAVALVQPALDKFYGLLSDEQKARFTALGEDQRRQIAARRGNRPLVESCGAQSAAMQWPAAEIDARLRPTDAQRTSLVALQDASAKAAEMLKTSCQADDAVTPPARLTAVGNRLDTMLQAVKLVRSALDDFYGTLSDEQKAQFEAIGPRRTALSDRSDTTRRHSRRYGF